MGQSALGVGLGLAMLLLEDRFVKSALESISEGYSVPSIFASDVCKCDVCEMRAFFVRSMCFKVCSQLESFVIIQGSLGRATDS